jgi:hypothetical protein
MACIVAIEKIEKGEFGAACGGGPDAKSKENLQTTYNFSEWNGPFMLADV